MTVKPIPKNPYSTRIITAEEIAKLNEPSLLRYRKALFQSRDWLVLGYVPDTFREGYWLLKRARSCGLAAQSPEMATPKGQARIKGLTWALGQTWRQIQLWRTCECHEWADGKGLMKARKEKKRSKGRHRRAGRF